MSRRRILAVLIAAAAAGVLFSLPSVIREHLRETARTALGGVANGTVVAVGSKGEASTVLVEYRLSPGAERHQLRAPVETIGFLAPRPRLQMGDPVLVAYDPSDPSRAELFTVRPLWTAVVVRGALAFVLVFVAVVLFFSRRAGG